MEFRLMGCRMRREEVSAHAFGVVGTNDEQAAGTSAE